MNARIWMIAVFAAIVAANVGIAAAGDPPPDGLATPALPKELTIDLGGGVKLELILIPAGKFYMGTAAVKGEFQKGAPFPKDANEKPRHLVQITKLFYLGKYPITQEQWQAVVGANPSHFQGPKNPVEEVSWQELCGGVSGQSEFAGSSTRSHLHVANGGAMGICVPREIDHALQLRERRVAARRLRLVFSELKRDHSSGRRKEAERMGSLRHARKRRRVVPGCL